MDKELKESCYDISTKNGNPDNKGICKKAVYSNLYKNTPKSAFMSYTHLVIRESRVHIIQLPVIKSERDILQQLN
jgi:hypothetical protein